MKTTEPRLEFDCRRWESTHDDLARIDSTVIRRILFEIFLINDFEHAVLCKTDKIAGTHRSHHHFLAKVMDWVLPSNWNPCAATAEDVVLTGSQIRS